MIEAFTLERVGAYFDQVGYHWAYDEEALVGSWNEIYFRFSAAEDSQWLLIQTKWEAPEEVGHIDPKQARSLLQNASNEWNRQYLQPTAHPVNDADVWKVFLDLAVFFGEPCTDKQIEVAIDRAIDVHLQAHETLPNLLAPII